MINVPDRFLVNGRSPVEEFEPNEPLYFRFDPKHFSDENWLPVAAIRFPDFSVNRGEFSEPADVLFPYWTDWGVAEFQVQAIPLSLVSGDGREFEFKIKHDPIDINHPYYNHPHQQFENYAHSEVRVFENGEHLKKKPPPEFVKKQFRMKMSDKTKIVPS